MRAMFFMTIFVAGLLLQNAQSVPTFASGREGQSIRDLVGEPLSRPRHLQARMQDVWQSFLAPDGLKVSYITYAHFLPLQLAAFGLQGLYQAVMVSAVTNEMTQQEPSNAIRIKVGCFRLTLFSNQKISWALLKAFALRMWILAGLGFTPGYQINFVGPSGMTLRADLRISGQAGTIANPPQSPGS